CAALLLVALLAGGQVVMNQQVQVGSSQAQPPTKAQPTKEELKRGQQMLERAEASANGMEGGMRAYGLLQVAKAYAPTDRKKAVTLLDEALQATHALDNDESQLRT